ncbi:TetR/AcrR family transcriptional regulator [Paenibacillus lactis]|uniref:TetR/AcrR family transcriptional regulator n=1 Tax=Paenibacillus lactis TaxID=228574 RepID=UPI001B096987|nr:TetR/AcrR family transcriptional regulator [Paenibacillus lactis]GIO88969.1 TetR family transcriptional regulator [Paenibacillus lactis]
MSPRPGIDRHQLLQAAAELADQGGFHSVTLAALAGRLGVRSPSLYNHVDGLPGLHAALTQYGLQILHERLLKAVAGRSGEEALRHVCIAYVEFARTHPGLYEAALQPIQPDHADTKQIGDDIVGLLLQVLAHYGLEEAEALHSVRTLRSLCHGFSSLERGGQFAMNLSLDDSLAYMIEIFIQGLNAQRRQH